MPKRRYPNRLKELRESHVPPLSQKQLSEKLGLKLGTYKYWEQGLRDMKGGTLAMFADFYGVTTDYILEAEDERSSRLDELVAKISGLPDDGIEEVRTYVDFLISKRG